MKTCTRCKVEKNVSEFWRRGKGYNSWCKSCASSTKTKWAQENRDKVRRNQLWTRYRLRQEDWDRLLEQQGGTCAVCRVAEPVHVDHDHACCPEKEKSCGECVRGILCQTCNHRVGWYELLQDPVIATALASYLRPHRSAA